MEVLLTRTDDVVVSLEARTAMANAAGADLFVSIHLNDSEVAIAHGGVTTFVLDTTEDAQALRLAARENGTTTAEVTGMTRLLAELQREDQVLASRRLADRVQQALLSRGRAVLPELADRGVRSALFAVLVGARMPAVLVEASFLTDPDELRALRTSRYRQALAEGIAEGIVHYVHRE
jgi:N-acetylmuramoyl-L-alanine amidase